MENVFFEVVTPVNFKAYTSFLYWKIITQIKHPNLSGEEESVKVTLIHPDEIRRSKKDPKIMLFYRKLAKKHLCVIVKQEGRKGFLVTAYFTDKIKEGEQIWKK